jgi:L-threonylcarbamoyladenylate synthase
VTSDETAQQIKNGAVGILPTDTIYGICGKAMDKEVYGRIVRLKKRESGKKFVILVSSWEHLAELGIVLSDLQKSKLSDFWPGQVTAVLDASGAPDYLASPDKTIAVRWPDKPALEALVEETGPIIATSVNEYGKPFLNSLEQIKDRFLGLDFYLVGEVAEKPSRIIRIFRDGTTKQLR